MRASEQRRVDLKKKICNGYRKMSKLLADRMLSKLARKLRLLGYDCEWVEDEAQSGLNVFRQALKENRILITVSERLINDARETKALALHVDRQIILVPPEDLPGQIRTVVKRAPIDFENRAFTRCSDCNRPLEEQSFESIASRLPPRVHEQHPDPVMRCPSCDRLFWPGTHTEHMIRDFQFWLGIELGEREVDS